MGTRPGRSTRERHVKLLLCMVAQPQGLACLQSEERTALALQRCFLLLRRAQVRAVQSVRVLEALALLGIFRGRRHGPLAELVVMTSGWPWGVSVTVTLLETCSTHTTARPPFLWSRWTRRRAFRLSCWNLFAWPCHHSTPLTCCCLPVMNCYSSGTQSETEWKCASSMTSCQQERF